MSGDFVLDPPGKVPLGLAWMPSGAAVQWVVGAVADRVEDAGLAAELREFVAADYSFISLGMFTAAQAAEITRVIRESLTAAAEARFPGSEVVLGWIAELVAMVERAEAAPDVG
ncbi:hypothetical protein [Amycolatopsis sp. NPDC021455]|uniref:hypothetical protein n=1 Tax=Amycolatopsis sp. NPDC021455 TaxID=3154901 RepID=UPI0033E7D100